jgi:hypothetical protein
LHILGFGRSLARRDCPLVPSAGALVSAAAALLAEVEVASVVLRVEGGTLAATGARPPAPLLERLRAGKRLSATFGDEAAGRNPSAEQGQVGAAVYQALVEGAEGGTARRQAGDHQKWPRAG